VPFTPAAGVLMVGERTNTNGSKAFREALLAADWEKVVDIGREAVREGASMIDLCVDYVGRDGAVDMRDAASRLATASTLPIVLDSTEPPVIEAGLECVQGKAIVNSLSLKDGEERFVVALLGVVEDQFRAIGVHALRGERVVEADLGAELHDRRSDALHRETGLAQGAEHEGLGDAHERHGGLPAGARENRDQRPAVLGVGPGVQRGDRRVEVRRALAQGEDRGAESRIVAPEGLKGCRGGGQRLIVLRVAVVSDRLRLLPLTPRRVSRSDR